MRNHKNLSLIVATQINRDGQIRTHTLGKKKKKTHTDLKDLHAITDYGHPMRVGFLKYPKSIGQLGGSAE
jgi:hypothetical protein